ncbi:hypothetical protein BS78_05G059400 [Paspalum vaginatum]|nr:hypothetical protein BS78_05G059400 [Paspalum vaginatum]
MDNQPLVAICEHLVSSLCTKGTYIFREGDPVTMMLLIIRGKLESSTRCGRTGFFNLVTLKPGDFCGEELLAWALVPEPTNNLPPSTRTVKALVDVEAFALQAEDLKSVASQFRQLRSKKFQHAFRCSSLQWRTWAACFIQCAWRRYSSQFRRLRSKNTFRFYSQQWRTWAACFIQYAWRQYERRKMIMAARLIQAARRQYESNMATDSSMRKSFHSVRLNEVDYQDDSPPENSLTVKSIALTWKAPQNIEELPNLRKPDEPDFSVEPDD